MKFNFKRNLFATVTVTGFLFFSSTALSVDLQSAVNDVCECHKKPNELIEQSLSQLQAAQAGGDYSQLVKIQGEMMGAMDVVSNCFESLPEKYPEIDANKELQDKVLAMAEKQCPNPAKAMMGK